MDKAKSERIDSFAPARFDLRFTYLCRSRPRGSIRGQADPTAKFAKCVCHDTLPRLVSFS